MTLDKAIHLTGFSGILFALLGCVGVLARVDAIYLVGIWTALGLAIAMGVMVIYGVARS